MVMETELKGLRKFVGSTDLGKAIATALAPYGGRRIGGAGAGSGSSASSRSSLAGSSCSGQLGSDAL